MHSLLCSSVAIKLIIIHITFCTTGNKFLCGLWNIYFMQMFRTVGCSSGCLWFCPMKTFCTVNSFFFYNLWTQICYFSCTYEGGLCWLYKNQIKFVQKCDISGNKISCSSLNTKWIGISFFFFGNDACRRRQTFPWCFRYMHCALNA